MNKYIDVNRLEFVVTNHCTGSCKHCSIGEIENNESINTEVAVGIINELAKVYSINSVMTFGGEPLLQSDTVCKIHETAHKNNIEDRSIITNGYFSKDYNSIGIIAKNICNSNINKILLSVDTFHQENIPIEYVTYFAKALLKNGFKGLKTHPAWLVNKEHDNIYNKNTKEILENFKQYGVVPTDGNNIFPAGNALKYLNEYFQKPSMEKLFAPCGTSPYSEKIDEIKCISINPNGDVKVCSVSIGNVYAKSILEIIKEYDPYCNLYTKLLVEGGVKKLYEYVLEQGIEIDIENCYSSCMLCYKIMKKIKEKEL